MGIVIISNVTIVIKIQQLKIFVPSVEIQKKLEKMAYSFLQNVKNVTLQDYCIRTLLALLANYKTEMKNICL